MRKMLITLSAIVCLAHAIGYSHRIQALGADFANLIPDYETDLYRNPELLELNMAGIAYGPIIAEPIQYPVGPSHWHEIPLQLPFNVLLLSKKIGVLSEFMFGYHFDNIQTAFGWTSVTQYVVRFENVGMLRIKNEVWNIYVDGSIEENKYIDSYAYSELQKISEYFLKVAGSLTIGKFFDIDLKVGIGLFEIQEEMSGYGLRDQRVAIPSGRLGLYYRNAPSPYRFTSWYLDVGGPISWRDVHDLPYSVYSNVYDYDRLSILFGNTFTSNVAWARGIPIKNNGFVAFGIHYKFLHQKVNEVERDNDLRAITHVISFPTGIEWNINEVAIRFGTVVSYDFESTRAWDTESDILVNEEITHTIDYDYSFGFGWQPTERFVIDLYSRSPLRSIRDWAIYVKYLF